MLHLIAYDITNDRRLRRVAAIDDACDSVIDYPIGLLDRRRINTLGAVSRQTQRDLVF